MMWAILPPKRRFLQEPHGVQRNIPEDAILPVCSIALEAPRLRRDIILHATPLSCHRIILYWTVRRDAP
jgi:hypothetical protein